MAGGELYRASTTAPVNIAVIKYWGKRDPTLNLPTNSSLSVTLSQSDLRTHTTATCSSSYSLQDSLLLNGSPQDINNARTQACLFALRSLRAELEAANPSLPKISAFPLRLVSENNFPTAAGLASSAAGFAALVRAIADLYALPASPTELSRIARQGSGSACRSLFGGYVAWEMGEREDGFDSVAVQVAPASHWPDMRALILVVSAEKKGVSSTTGMQTTVKTSSLFPARAKEVVPQRMKEMKAAITARDFDSFAKLTMRDSNSFHATCLDTDPPIFYLNDVSRAAIRVVEDINASTASTDSGTQGIVATYTFDAGPNAVIYYLEENRAAVLETFQRFLQDKHGWGDEVSPSKESTITLDPRAVKVLEDGVSRVILTRVGEGPISTQNHLVGEDGLPVKAAS